MRGNHNDDAVYFWKQDEKPYGVLCQWFPSRFTDKEGTVWENMEQYIMAMKAKEFKDNASYDRIRRENNPKTCKAIGREVAHFNDKVWKKKAPMLAYIGNCMKFEQNPALKRVLLSTGDRPLYEASPYDKIWGIGLDAEQAANWDPKHEFPGTNLLGKALMKVRTRFVVTKPETSQS